ncbi:hypothetical protein ES707_08073 [subsurface metagenome]
MHTGCLKKPLTGSNNTIIPYRMSKYICKVEKSAGNFRICIPKSIIQEKRWGDVLYVIVEDHWPDKIAIRRMLDEKSLEPKDHRG